MSSRARGVSGSRRNRGRESGEVSRALIAGNTVGEMTGTLGTNWVKSAVIAGGLKLRFARYFTALNAISSEPVNSRVSDIRIN